MESLGHAIRRALLTSEPRAKCFATRDVVRRWRRGELVFAFEVPMPDRPAWPDRLDFRPPSQMPKRGRGGSQRNRIALWHALAHIEFVAIDLALDIVGRFAGSLPDGEGGTFADDFLSVAADEAMHFALLDRKLRSLGSHYGALPVHDGLWQSASDTAHDLAARLAIVPMVLEARGLDVTPATLARVRSAGDENGARILSRILDDEIRHVALGTTHFVAQAEKRGNAAPTLWKKLVKRHFTGRIQAPFNDSARLAAGLSREFYAGIAS